MNTFTRRTFGKRMLAAGALPLLKHPPFEFQAPSPGEAIAVPETIAGYKLTQEEKGLAAKFLSTHEKNMAPLRENDLPNSLAPQLIFATPLTTRKNGEGNK